MRKEELQESIRILELQLSAISRGNPEGLSSDDEDEINDDLYDLRQELEDLELDEEEACVKSIIEINRYEDMFRVIDSTTGYSLHKGSKDSCEAYINKN